MSEDTMRILEALPDGSFTREFVGTIHVDGMEDVASLSVTPFILTDRVTIELLDRDRLPELLAAITAVLEN